MGSLAVVAANQTPEPSCPFQTTLDDVPVPAQPLGRLDPLAGDPRLDPTPRQRLTTGRIVVALVAMQLAGPLPRPADRLPNRSNAIDHILEE